MFDVKEAVVGTLLSMFGVTTWVLPYTNFAPNAPSWFISTVFLWYWYFPILLPRVQKWSNEQIAYGIVEYFWMQIALGLLVVIGFGGFAGSYVSQKFIS